jgi:hypothetical protein
MKLRNIKIIGVLLVVLINLLGAQPAKAMNPLEEAYVANIEKYTLAVDLEQKKYDKLGASPAFQSNSPTSAKYKSAAKNMIRSIDKMSVTFRKLEALTAPESFASTEPFLKGWIKYSLEYYALSKKALAPKFKYTEAVSEELMDLAINKGKWWEELSREFAQDYAELQTPPTN